MFIFRKTESSYGKKMAKNGRITAIYFETNANAKIVKANNSFFVPSSQILVKKGLLRKTKSKNFQYFSLKTKKRLRKIQTLPSTTRQCHIRFGNGQTIGNLGVYHRFRSLEY